MTRKNIPWLGLLLSITLFGVACSVDQVITTIKLASSMVSGLATATCSAQSSACQAITKSNAVIQPLLTEAQTLYDQYKASGDTSLLTKISGLLTTAESDLNGIVPSLGITDPATRAKIQKGLSIAVLAVQAAEVIINALHGGAAVGVAKAKTVTTPADLKRQFNDAMRAKSDNAAVDAAFAKAAI